MTYNPKQSETWSERKTRERGERAILRQLDYQKAKARDVAKDAAATQFRIKTRAALLRKRLEGFRAAKHDDRILEVGSGAHGLVFGYEEEIAIGIDPLAVEYKSLFPAWHENTTTVAAIGEELPFEKESFDIVLSDNVVDHAANPAGVVKELVRVLNPSGILYFSVNTHHPIYQIVSDLHGIWNAVGIRFEIGPFADHTIHFTENRIVREFEMLPLELVWRSPSSERPGNTFAGKGIRNKIKRLFPKNNLFEIIARKPA